VPGTISPSWRRHLSLWPAHRQDMLYPELARLLAVQGVELLVGIAAVRARPRPRSSGRQRPSGPRRTRYLRQRAFCWGRITWAS